MFVRIHHVGPTKELSLAWSNIASAFRVLGVAGMYHHASFKKSYQLSSFYNNFIAKILDTFPHKAVQAFLPKSRESGTTKYTCIFLNSVWSNGGQQPCFTLTFSHRWSCLSLEYQVSHTSFNKHKSINSKHIFPCSNPNFVCKIHWGLQGF